MKNRCVVVIPSYKPQVDFIDYVKVLSKKVYKIIVINDGSLEEYDNIFNKIKEVENVTLISYAKNMGKGYALKQGFTYAYNNFSSECVIVTADCDGQHKIKDIFKVYETAIKNEDALVLGSRDFSFKNVPKKSKMGNAIMRKTFNFFYGGKVYDTQTGLRAFSNKITNRFTKVKGDRFEYELALLIFAQKNQIEIIETKIETVYPENAKEHKTHFKAFRDSVKVFIVMLKNVGGYFLSSVISGVIDVLIFSLLSIVVFEEIKPLFTLISVVSARVVSSLLNYFIKYKYLFKGKSKSSLVKYYILWLSVLGVSFLNVITFGKLFNNVILVKIIGDIILGVISYEIQCKWLFNNTCKFYGCLARITKNSFRLFTKRYKTKIKRDNKPCIYVCRHLNMHGAYTTLKTFDFDVHPLVLGAFFNKEEGYNHLKDYTFSAKHNKKSKKFSIKAKVSAWFLYNLINSLEGVPVYRKSNKSIITLKKSLDYLVEGESLIVFPDIDYTASYDTISNIYDGFLLLGEMYNKKTGEDLRFVPLYIDEKNKEIIDNGSIIINDFKNDRESAKESIINGINYNPNFNKVVECTEAVENKNF